jgi:hypothetical protein
VEVRVGREWRLGERIDLTGQTPRDMGLVEGLVRHRAVLGLDQGVVVGAPGPRLGERFDVELVEQVGHLAVLARSGTGELAMEAVCPSRQPAHVLRRVDPREGLGGRATRVLQTARLAKLGHEAGHLRPRQRRHLAQVALDQARLRLAPLVIPEAPQGLGDQVYASWRLSTLQSTGSLPSRRARIGSSVWSP